MSYSNTEAATQIISATKWARGTGISDTTLWRWSQQEKIKLTNIAGRLYISQNEIERFTARATAGEFAKPAKGCAAKQSERALA